ncbi:MAG TPA: ABC transporter ATP-binding protein [Bordetella sp.]|jgi:multiple sugar transport system ATP-binding protein|nr:ABC transporter ATP-binding protein [Bordetella sp.]
MASLELRGIHKYFQQQHSINGVSLKVEDGELLILLGPSGCGKSTLMRIISGLDTPTEGEVLIDGQAVTRLRPKDRNVAMVFQNYALYPHLTLYENIAFPLRVRGTRGTDVDGKVRWAAKMVGIEHLLDRKPRQTSGGERQRTALARSLVRDPDVFLLDEPLSNLDAKMRHTAREELREFQHRVKGTWLYVTHDQTEAMGMGDRVAVLNQGQVRQIGTPQEIYLHPADMFVATFVGMPPMNLVETPADVIGFRPEHYLPRAFFRDEGELVDIPMRLRRVEYLGGERLFYGETEGNYPATRVIARIPATVPYSQEVGELAAFAVRAGDLSLFDPQTQLARPRTGDARVLPLRQRSA